MGGLFSTVIIKLVFDINLYQVVGNNFSCFVIVGGRKTMVYFKIKGIQTQLNITLTPYKQLLVYKGIVGSVVFIKFEIVIKEPFKFIQLLIKVFSNWLCSVRFLCFYFINGVIINEFRNNNWLLMFKKPIN